MSNQNEIILEMQHVYKAYPGVQALDNVSFDLKKGEVHCLLGENGAGKSTLIKILSGAIVKDSGKIILKNEEVDIQNAHDSKMLGISTIYQEMNLVPTMNVVDNMFLGDEVSRKKISIVDHREMRKRTHKILEHIGIKLDTRTLVRDLSVAQQQMVEIAKSLIYQREIIIMDEPTSAISEKDTQELFRIVKELKKQGVSIIYISHRLQELKEIVDRVTVLRDGKYINTVGINEATIDELIEMMVGRTLEDVTIPRARKTGETVLEVKNVSRGNQLKDISFELKKGEVLGFAGLVGSGRSELMKIVFGADKPDSGNVYIKGERVRKFSTKEAVRRGISYLSEDRKSEGLVPGMSIMHNITLASLEKVSGKLALNLKAEKKVTNELVKSLSIATSSVDKKVNQLSGGNQQKVVVGKWLLNDSDIIIFDEPTRGIDVGARAEIYHLINELADAGKSVIIVSSDLPEVLRMSNRIVVMHSGMITGETQSGELATQQKIMNLMLGGVKS